MDHRILIVVHGWPPTARAGAEIHAWRTAIGLSQRGTDVRVLAFEAHGRGPLVWSETTQDGLVVRRVSGDLELGQEPFRASYDNAAVAGVMQDLVRTWRPQLVYVFSGYLMSSSVARVAIDAGIPVVINLTDYWWFCHTITLLKPDGTRCTGPTLWGCAECLAERRRRWRLPARVWPAAARSFWRAVPGVPGLRTILGVETIEVRRAVTQSVLRGVSACIAPSRYLANFYLDQGVDPGIIHTFRQGLDLDRCPLRVPSDRLRFGYTGQMKAHKGVARLLEAWSMLRGPRARTLLLYGSSAGEEAFGARMQELASQLQNVEWRGPFRSDQVWDVMAGLDVVIIPSTWVENSPNVILECQAMGVPVVGSNIGGIAELVRHDHDGLLFETDSAADLARQLQRLLDEPDLVGRLSANAPPIRTTEDELRDVMALFRRFLPA